MTVKQVYLPIVITVDTETGELTRAPYVDFDGAPWQFLDSEENVWIDDDGVYGWERDEVTELVAIDRVADVLAKWGDT